jgi:cytochrome c-type biogenesis protein CcmH/NrfG
MSGWVALALLAAASMGLLRVLGLRGAILQLGAAALLLGAGGYAVAGRPSLPGAPAGTAQRQAPIPLTNLRHAFFGRFGPTEHWQLIAESYARRGDTENAAKTMQAAVGEHPGDPILWIGQGNALTDHSGGLTPASELAFRRAIELAPDHPAPRFFFGLALARSGQAGQGVAVWRQLLAEAPADASWRPLVEDAIRAVEPGRRAQAAAGS